jgi:hypothetical protein
VISFKIGEELRSKYIWSSANNIQRRIDGRQMDLHALKNTKYMKNPFVDFVVKSCILYRIVIYIQLRDMFGDKIKIRVNPNFLQRKMNSGYSEFIFVPVENIADSIYIHFNGGDRVSFDIDKRLSIDGYPGIFIYRVVQAMEYGENRVGRKSLFRRINRVFLDCSEDLYAEFMDDNSVKVYNEKLKNI